MPGMFDDEHYAGLIGATSDLRMELQVRSRHLLGRQQNQDPDSALTKSGCCVLELNEVGRELSGAGGTDRRGPPEKGRIVQVLFAARFGICRTMPLTTDCSGSIRNAQMRAPASRTPAEIKNGVIQNPR